MPSGDLAMYYQGAATADGPASVGMAMSESGFKWQKKGCVFGPGAEGSFDAGGVERPFVLPLPTSKVRCASARLAEVEVEGSSSPQPANRFRAGWS
jgi:hypothetical protein